MPDAIRPVTPDADRARLIAELHRLSQLDWSRYGGLEGMRQFLLELIDLLAAEGNRCDAEMCECGHFHCRHHGIWRGSEQACDDCDCRCFIVAPSPPGGGR